MVRPLNVVHPDKPHALHQLDVEHVVLPVSHMLSRWFLSHQQGSVAVLNE